MAESSYTKEQKSVYAAAWWRKLSPAEQDAYNFKSSCRKRGITIEDYAELLKKQNGVCAICKKPESLATTKPWRLSIDHDHADYSAFSAITFSAKQRMTQPS